MYEYINVYTCHLYANQLRAYIVRAYIVRSIYVCLPRCLNKHNYIFLSYVYTCYGSGKAFKMWKKKRR